MIKSIIIKGLHGKWDPEINFNDDITLITGKNGAGKTAVIKLAWYLISGNIDRTIKEVSFLSAKVITDTCSISIESNGMDQRDEVLIRAEIFGAKLPLEAKIIRQDWGVKSSEIDIINNHVARATGSSLFFPTFRRIEGGFASSYETIQQRSQNRVTLELSRALDSYANAISVFKHQFIATLSTHDIHALLTEKFAEASRKNDELHRHLYTELKGMIRTFRDASKSAQKKPNLGKYKTMLDDLSKVIDTAEEERTKNLEKFEKLADIIFQIFSQKGIEFTNSITYGDPLNSIKSDLLSAGEKQFLSFLCYNAFLTKSVVVIDEPEISLHPDWQRRLIPTLKSQNSQNQFILTTHSPFIYSKFPEKEKCISNDRGE